MVGVQLEANFHIITGQTAAISNIKKCVNNASLAMTGLTLEPLASATSVLDHQELEAGVALVDIGEEQPMWQFLKTVLFDIQP